MKKFDNNKHILSKIGGGGGNTHSQKASVGISRKNEIVSQIFQCVIFGLYSVISAFLALAKTFLEKLKFLINKILTNCYPRLQKTSSGCILILVGCFVPVLLGMMKYTELQFEKRWRSVESLADPNDATYYKECAREIALAVAKAWDSSKTLGEQKDKVYEIAKNIYNAHPCLQKGGVRSAIPGLIITTMDGEKVELLPSKRTFSKDYVKISIVDDKEHAGKIRVQTDYQVAHAIPAECNANIILAVPTNSGISGSLNKIGTAFGKFAENFNNVRGVYMGIVPYSGKLSIPSDRKNSWTTKLPVFKANDAQQLLIGACLYATKGIKGTALTEQYSWDNGCPIMFRRGAEITDDKYSKNPYYSGILLSKDNPNSIDKKYIQMDLRPCTLSNASLLGMQCGNDCTQFFANPHAMVEPMDDMTAFKTKCNGLTSFNHAGNDSSFIFAALEWANNMLQSWTNDPKKAVNTNGDSGRLGSQSKTTAGRKNYIVLLVNKPDYFKDGEMTYLGFSDDWKEENIGTESIKSGQNRSSRGALQLSGSMSLSSGYYQCTSEAACTLTCTKKHLVKIVVDSHVANTPGEIQFTSVSNTTDNNKIKKNTWYYVVAQREFFVEAGQILDNLQINFSAKNLRFVSAEITNRTIDSGIATKCNVSYNGSTATITTNCERAIKLKVTPKNSWIKFGNKAAETITVQKDIPLGTQSSNVAYTKQNVEVKKVQLKIETTETVEKEDIIYEKNSGYSSFESMSFNIDDQVKAIRFELTNTNGQVDFKWRCNGALLCANSGYLWVIDGSGGVGKHEGYTYNLVKGTKAWDYLLSKRFGRYPSKAEVSRAGINVKILKVYDSTDTVTTSTLISEKNYNPSPIKISESGELTVTVAPKMDPHPSVSYTNLSGNNTTLTSEINEFSPTEVTIHPKYTRQSNGDYVATVTLANIESVEASLADTIKIYSISTAPATARTDSGNVVLRKATNNETDGTKAVKTLTTKACSKENLGDNTTVFLVKYGSGDYSYIGSNVQHYDATEGNFESKLNEIAAKIKTSAGYKHARRVK